MQPEDVLLHEFSQAEHEGKQFEDLRQGWLTAGGAPSIGRAGATPESPGVELVELALKLLIELDSRPAAADYLTREPRDIADIVASRIDAAPVFPAPGRAEFRERITAAWTGRLVGCLLGKVVEKLPREGIATILQSSGQWPLRHYFTARGVPDEVLEQYPWNRASRVHSLAENISGMPGRR